MLQKDRDWIDARFDCVIEKIAQLRVDVATLKVKAGAWGVLGGAATVLVGIGIYLLTHYGAGAN